MAINNVKRADLCVQYKHTLPPKSPFETNTGLSNMLNQSMPMVGMFLRNKFIAWFSLIQSFHFFLNADPDQASSSNSKSGMDQSPIMRIILSLVGLLVCYMNLVFPQPVGPPIKPKDSSASEPAVEPAAEPVGEKESA